MLFYYSEHIYNLYDVGGVKTAIKKQYLRRSVTRRHLQDKEFTD